MLAYLAATCITFASIVAVTVALGTATERLRRLADRWLPAPEDSYPRSSPTASFRPETQAARRRHKAEAGRRSGVAERVAGRGPGSTGAAPDGRTSARILPFVRKRPRDRASLRLVPPPDAAARRG